MRKKVTQIKTPTITTITLGKLMFDSIWWTVIL